MKILVVDDERTIADYFVTFFNARGHRALALYTSAEALEHVEMLKFDVVLIGYMMPRMLGTEAAKRIRSLRPNTRIAIIMEPVPPEVRKALQREGYDFDYIDLPVDCEVLLERVSRNVTP